MKDFLVSVVVTTKNESEVLGRLLKSIKKQSHRNIEILIVDNYSSDNTKDIASKYTKFVFDKGPERSAQRNFGAKKAKGKYVFFLDADMELSKNVIRDCLEVMGDRKKVGAVTIPETSVASNYWEKVKAYERSFYNLEGDEGTDAARFFRKDVFRKLRGYDESLTGPEDWDLSERLKRMEYKIGRVKSIIYHYERVPSLWRLMKKKYYYGLGSFSYLKKQGVSHLNPKTVYFLRPVFYKNWRKLLSQPMLTIAMMFMLMMELLAGGFGYVIGRWRNG